MTPKEIIKEYDKDEVYRIFTTYSDDTQELILTAGKHQNKNPNLAKMLIMETNEQTVREVMYLHVHCEVSTGPFTRNLYQLTGIIRGLKQYDRFQNTSLDALTGDDLAAAGALMNFTAALYAYCTNPPLHITTPDNPNTSEIYLNETAARLVAKHRDYTGELIHFLNQGFYFDPANLLAGFPQTDWYQKQDLHHVTAETITTAFNLLYLTAELTEHTDKEDIAMGGNDTDDDRPVYLNNPTLENFIERHPDQVNPLITYIRERRTADLDGFHEYTNNGTALREGVL